jgi:hypothetical protein
MNRYITKSTLLIIGVIVLIVGSLFLIKDTHIETGIATFAGLTALFLFAFFNSAELKKRSQH